MGLHYQPQLMYGVELPEGLELDDNTFGEGIENYGEGESGSRQFVGVAIIDFECDHGSYELAADALSYTREQWMELNTIAVEHKLDPPAMWVVSNVS